MKKTTIIILSLIIALSVGACAKNLPNTMEESENIKEETQYTEEEKVDKYDDFIEEKKEDFNDIVSNAKELAKSPSLSPSWIGDVKKELDQVILKADEILDYDNGEIPEKYKEVHEKYVMSVEKIKKLSEDAPGIALTMNEEKIKELAEEFEDAYNAFIKTSQEYEALKNE